MSKLDKNAIKKIREENAQGVSTEDVTETITTTGSSALEKLRKKKKEEKYRTSVYLKQDVFEKLITLNAETGESFTEIIEVLLEDALQDVIVKPRYVEAYKKNLEKKREEKEQQKNED